MKTLIKDQQHMFTAIAKIKKALLALAIGALWALIEFLDFVL